MRGFGCRQYLFVIDGSKALRSAIDRVFSKFHPVQRCRSHIVGRDPRLPEGWNVPSRVNPYEPGSLGSGAAEQSAVSKQTRHVSLRTQSGGTGKRSGRTERECMAPSWHLGRVLLGESGNGVVESPVFRRRQQRLRMHRDKKQSSPPAFRATERCCMDRGGDGIRPFPSRSVKRCVRTQAVRVRSSCSGLSGRPGFP